MDGHFRVQDNSNGVQTQSFDRLQNNNLFTVNGETSFGGHVCGVTRGDRAVEVAAIRSLTNHDELLAVQLFTQRFGFFFGFQVARFQLSFLRVKLCLVGFRCGQGFALGQQEVTGVTRLHVDDFTHLAQFGHTFKKDNLHVLSPYLTA